MYTMGKEVQTMHRQKEKELSLSRTENKLLRKCKRLNWFGTPELPELDRSDEEEENYEDEDDDPEQEEP